MDPIDLILSDLGATLARAPDHIWAAVASAGATLLLALGLAPRRGGPARAARAPTTEDEAEACDFLIHGATIQPLTGAARTLVESFGPGGGRLARLRAHLAVDCPGIEADLEALALYGVSFRRHCQPEGAAPFEVHGAPRGGAALISIRAASDEARALREAETALRRTQDEARFLQAAFDRAPVLAWSLGRDGQVAWANAPYRDRFAARATGLPDHRVPDAFARASEEVPLTARGGGQRRRVALPAATDGESHWYELNEAPGPNGETLGFALEADDLVAAEASLRRFIETLTETFAHLPIGLAVFDKNRRLGLFNPALTDLVKIDAVWLAGRPSLRDFLERLRETRQMPEQKDFASWRRKLTEIEEGAREGAYEENWVLPSGKILRVTGRPHPQGAVAFLFEDISTAIHLERRYRSELELSQATLDRMAEAVAVFDTSGMLVFVNSAFESLWEMEPMQGLHGPGVGELTEFWAERCRATPAWARLREFATGAEARAAWTEPLETCDGRVLQLLVAPLPDASALVVFRCLFEERTALAEARSRLEVRAAAERRDLLAEEMARAEAETAAETALARIADAVPAAPDLAAFQSLAAAAEALREALARLRALRALPRDEAAPGAWLAALLESRGLRLVLSGEPELVEGPARRPVWALALAAAEVAAQGGAVAVSIAAHPEGVSIAAETEAAPAARLDGPSLGLARRLIAAAGGALEAETSQGRRLFRADLPAEAPAEVARSA